MLKKSYEKPGSASFMIGYACYRNYFQFNNLYYSVNTLKSK